MYTFGFGRYNVVFSSLAAAMLHEFGMSTNPPPLENSAVEMRCLDGMAWQVTNTLDKQEGTVVKSGCDLSSRDRSVY